MMEKCHYFCSSHEITSFTNGSYVVVLMIVCAERLHEILLTFIDNRLFYPEVIMCIMSRDMKSYKDMDGGGLNIFCHITEYGSAMACDG